jgi:hypothetical protein
MSAVSRRGSQTMHNLTGYTDAPESRAQRMGYSDERPATVDCRVEFCSPVDQHVYHVL